MKTNEIPRRIRIDLSTSAELAIRKAVEEVEKVGADERLTESVVLLSEAREQLADYIDEIPFKRRMAYVSEVEKLKEALERILVCNPNVPHSSYPHEVSEIARQVLCRKDISTLDLVEKYRNRK